MTTERGTCGALSSSLIVSPFDPITCGSTACPHWISPAIARAYEIDQQLGWIEALALVWRPRSVRAKPVALTGFDAGHVAVPAVRRAIRHPHAMLLAVLVEQTQVDVLRRFGEDRKAGSFAVPLRAERKRLARPGFPFQSLFLQHRRSPIPAGARRAARSIDDATCWLQ